MQSFAATLLHEITHAKSGFTDVSREFETALTEVIGILSTVCLGGEAVLHQRVGQRTADRP